MGALAALVGLTFFTYYKKKPKLLIGSGIIMAVSLIGFSASTWAVFSLPLLVMMGGMQTAFSTVNSTIIQGITPDELRGRVTSWREVAFGIGPTGSILFGAIAQITGVQVSLGILGVTILIPSILLLARFSRLRDVE